MPYGALPPELVEFLQGPRSAVFGAVRPDGAPVTTPTWYGWRDGRIYLCLSPTGPRQRNIRADPRVALSVFGDSWYEHLSIRGRVVELRIDEDLSYVDALCMRYRGEPSADRDLRLLTALIEVEHWRTYGRPTS